LKYNDLFWLIRFEGHAKSMYDIDKILIKNNMYEFKSTFNVRCLLIFAITIFTANACTNINHDAARIEFYKLHQGSQDSLENYYEKYGNPLPKESPQAVELNEILTSIKSCLTDSQKEALEKIKVFIFPSDALFARSLPPNIIVLSSNIFSKDSPLGAETQGAIVGLIGHELCHLLYKHTEAKFGWTKYPANEERQEGFNQNIDYIKLARATKNIVKKSSFKVDIDYSEWYFEAIADLFAMKLMNKLNKNITEYLKYFQKIYFNTKKNLTLDSTTLQTILKRINRIKIYLDDNYTKHKLSGTYIFVDIHNEQEPRYYMLDPMSLYDEKDPEEYKKRLRRIHYWEEVIRQDSLWPKDYFCNIDSKIVTPEDFKPLKTEDGFFITVSFFHIPLFINGFSSLIFADLPEMTTHLKPTNSFGIDDINSQQSDQQNLFDEGTIAN